jgi:serine/threonine protein phosphatase PrpC
MKDAQAQGYIADLKKLQNEINTLQTSVNALQSRPDEQKAPQEQLDAKKVEEQTLRSNILQHPKVLVNTFSAKGVRFVTTRGRAGEDAAFYAEYTINLSDVLLIATWEAVQTMVMGCNEVSGSTMTMAIITWDESKDEGKDVDGEAKVGGPTPVIHMGCLGDSPLVVYDKDGNPIGGFISRMDFGSGRKVKPIIGHFEKNYMIHHEAGHKSALAVSRAIGDKITLRDVDAHAIEINDSDMSQPIRLASQEGTLLIASDGYEDNRSEYREGWPDRVQVKQAPLLAQYTPDKLDAVFNDVAKEWDTAVFGGRAKDDQTVFIVDIKDLTPNHTYVFAVFDGHGGSEVSRWASTNIANALGEAIGADVTANTVRYKSPLNRSNVKDVPPLQGGRLVYTSSWLSSNKSKRARLEDEENMRVTSMRMKRRAEQTDQGVKRIRHS